MKEVEAKEYYQQLEVFSKKCHDLIDGGMPYAAVLLCHELFRFLYPVDSFAAFKQVGPVDFAIKHIKKLIFLGDTLQGGVSPYLSQPTKSQPEEVSFERRTFDLYNRLWKSFDYEVVLRESRELLESRLPSNVIEKLIKGKVVLDMGCGSGRYTMALAMMGAKKVIGVDYNKNAYQNVKEICDRQGLPVEFVESSVLGLPFADSSFDFVFCNGVLHHTSSTEDGIKEFARVIVPGGAGFLYLYGIDGIFWNTRIKMREIFKKIPIDYTIGCFNLLNVPANRFIFCDTWYVPREGLISRFDLECLLEKNRLGYEKLIMGPETNLDLAISKFGQEGKTMWGEGEHRYILTKH